MRTQRRSLIHDRLLYCLLCGIGGNTDNFAMMWKTLCSYPCIMYVLSRTSVCKFHGIRAAKRVPYVPVNLLNMLLVVEIRTSRVSHIVCVPEKNATNARIWPYDLPVRYYFFSIQQLFFKFSFTFSIFSPVLSVRNEWFVNRMKSHYDGGICVLYQTEALFAFQLQWPRLVLGRGRGYWVLNESTISALFFACAPNGKLVETPNSIMVCEILLHNNDEYILAGLKWVGWIALADMKPAHVEKPRVSMDESFIPLHTPHLYGVYTVENTDFEKWIWVLSTYLMGHYRIITEPKPNFIAMRFSILVCRFSVLCRFSCVLRTGISKWCDNHTAAHSTLFVLKGID